MCVGDGAWKFKSEKKQARRRRCRLFLVVESEAGSGHVDSRVLLVRAFFCICLVGDVCRNLLCFRGICFIFLLTFVTRPVTNISSSNQSVFATLRRASRKQNIDFC